jgi:hypothetical protein
MPLPRLTLLRIAGRVVALFVGIAPLAGLIPALDGIVSLLTFIAVNEARRDGNTTLSRCCPGSA